MEYAVVRSSRKTVSLQITPEGELLVRAPRRCPKSYIDEFVRSKEPWITAHQGKVRALLSERERFTLKTGDVLSLCGKPVTVKVCPGIKTRLMRGTLYLPSGDLSRVRDPILRAFRRAAEPWLRERLDAWAERMNLGYRDLKFSTARRRWGSCTFDGVIRISVFLLFAPEPEIDYVLVHELAHRKVFNHSPAFWAVVSAYLPDWKERRDTLKTVQEQLFSQGFCE